MAWASNIILFIFVQVSTAQILGVNRNAAEAQTRRESNAEPVFLEKLGNLFLDFDEAFSRYTAPKLGYEDEGKEQLYNKNRASRSDYFERIRDNYRNLQKRVGSALGIDGDVSIMSDFLGINVQNNKGRSLVDVSLPFLPMKLSVNSNQVKNTDDMESSTNENSVSNPELPKSDFESNLQLGNMKINVGSKSSENMPRVHVNIKQPNVEARSSRQSARNENQDLEISSELESAPEDAEFSSTRGSEVVTTEFFETEDDAGISGRILGDVLYSESTFDKIMKRVIKDSTWFLDSDLSPSKTFERLNRFTKKVLQPRENSGDEWPPKKGLSDQNKQSTSDHEDKEHQLRSPIEAFEKTLLKSVLKSKPLRYKVGDNPIAGTIKLDIVPQSETDFEVQSQHEEKLLLAFTLEGVPLKLRMPVEVENSLQFLHETLSAAEVALNVPVNSYDDLEPAGKEVLQMGSGSGQMMARAIFVDLSDPQQLKSLLKTLRKFRSKLH